ncbi:MAG: hypothetical protein IT437_08610 [Phycisphaerales bacterium]|nr:hypothetical protein [Phycisphaerales bacterium]
MTEPGTIRLRRGDWWIALAVFAAALAVRVLFLLTWPDRSWPHSLWYEGDAPLWDEWARTLAAGGVFEHGLAIHAPGAAYLLHWLGFGGAQDYTWAKVLWCAASAAGCAMTHLVVAGEFGRRVGMIAAGLVAFSFASYVQAVSLNVEALYTPLVVAAVGLTHRLTRRPGWGAAATLGVVHGAALLLRAEHALVAALLVLPVVMGWWRERRPGARLMQRAGVIAVIAAVAFGVCLPWMIQGRLAAYRMNSVEAAATDDGGAEWTADGRAYIGSLPAFARADTARYLSYMAGREGGGPVTAERARAMLLREFGHEPEPLPLRLEVSSQGPLVFALGNSAGATGGFSKAALDPRFGADPTLSLAMPSHNYLYIHGYRAGWEWIRANPAAWARLVWRKLAIFADGAAQGMTAANVPLGRDGRRRAVDQFTASGSWRSVVWRCVLGGLALAGAVIAARARRGGAWMLVILAKLLVCVLFIGYARQAASILPALAVFVAAGLDGVLSLVERSAGRPRSSMAGAWIAAGAAAGVLAIAVDIVTFTRPGRPDVKGPVRVEQRWGGEAYLCPADMGLTTSSSPSR